MLTSPSTVLSLLLLLQPTTMTSPPAPTTAPDVDYLRYTDRVDQFASAADFAAGTLKGVAINGDHVELAPPASDTSYPRMGTWTSHELSTPFAFTELLATFNATFPARTGVVLETRVKVGEAWSPWLYVQSWGQTLTPPARVNKFEQGEVEVDILELKAPASAYQLRVTLQSFSHDAAVSPLLRRASVCYSGDTGSPPYRQPLPADLNWARDLGVPFRPQGDASVPKPLWSQICSPTCTTMVMEHFGKNLPTLDNAEAIFDPHYDMFGNWGRAVSRAGEQGFDAYLIRVRSLDDAKKYVAAGQPLIASIQFKKGEVEGFLYPQTAGHLIVIRGFTADGDAIVNDPASREKGNGVIYKAAELEKAWFRPGGVAYVIRRATAGGAR